MDTSSKIEAILFYKAEPIKVAKLANILSLSPEQTKEGLENLKSQLTSRGITLLEKGDEVMLSTNPETSDLIEQLTKEELSKDLGKAALETLSIILYRNSVTRAEIDYIRGVNSSFILRNLMIRGLIERANNPNDSRSYLYQPTFDLLAHLGISNVSELPEFNQVQTEILQFMNQEKLDNEGQD